MKNFQLRMVKKNGFHLNIKSGFDERINNIISFIL
jgi:hypothetical protein